MVEGKSRAQRGYPTQSDSRQPMFEADQYVGRTIIKNWLSISDDRLRQFEQEPDFPVPVVVGARRKYLGADLVRWLWTRQG